MDVLETLNGATAQQAETSAKHPWRMQYETRTTAWNWRDIYGTIRHDKDISDPLKRRLKSLLHWAGQLQWSKQELHMTCMELVVDFEATSGQYVRYEGTDIKERARIFRKYVEKVNSLCIRRKLPSVFPATPIPRSHGLRSVGAPALIGYAKRTPFVSPLTRYILEKHLSASAIQQNRWGEGFIPKYIETQAT